MRCVKVGDFLKFHEAQSLVGDQIVYVHRKNTNWYEKNCVWLPSGDGCHVSIGHPLNGGDYLEETDELLAMLAKWRLLHDQ